jgi:signal transduction histidine kinase
MNDGHAIHALDRIRDGVISLNRDRQVTYINETAQTLLEYKDTLGEVLNKKVNLSIHQQVDLHFEFKWEDRKWLEVHVYPSADGVTILVRDISSKKKIEEKHEKLRLLYETVNHVIFEKEPKKLLDALFHELSSYLDLDVYFNYAYDISTNKLKLMNYRGIPESVAQEIKWLELGEAVSGCVARDQNRMVTENIETSNDERVQFVKGFGIKAYACHPLMSYGKMIGTLSFGSSKRSSFTDEELDLMNTICQQVAATMERTLLISELTQKKEEAEKANLAKSKFVSMMSHELRTPLNSIIGFAQILEEDSRDPGQKNRVQKILKSSRHLLKLINDIIEIIRLDTGKRQVTQESIVINMLMEDCIKIVAPLAEEKGIPIHYVSDPQTDWNIKGDSERLTQIMLHLLTNAVKFTHPTGFITVTAIRDEQQMKVVVSDTGVGIPYEEHEKIFAPFYKIFHKDLNIEGAGIGLSIVKRLVEEMNGEVGVRSIPGEGSRFWFTLPTDFS